LDIPYPLYITDIPTKITTFLKISGIINSVTKLPLVQKQTRILLLDLYWPTDSRHGSLGKMVKPESQQQKCGL
jgi:hypothetical protein